MITLPEIILEYQRVAIELAEKFQTVIIEPLLSLIVASSEIYIPPDLSAPVCKDPDSDGIDKKLRRRKIRNRIHEKGYRNHPLTRE